MRLRAAAAALAALVFAVPSSVRAEWLRAESPNFVIYSEGSEARLRDRVRLLEEYDALVRSLTGMRDPATRKFDIYIVRDFGRLRMIREVGGAVQGFYLGTPGGMAAFVDESTPEQSNETLFHEYAHHFMSQYFPGAYPPWYSEGFAEYLMTARIEPTRVEIGRPARHRAVWLTQGGWMDIRHVLFGDRGRFHIIDLVRFYAQSWVAVHWFFSTPARRAALSRYLAALARGEDAQAALAPATGMTIEQLNNQLREYIRDRRVEATRVTRSGPPPLPPIALIRLPASADDLLIYDVALRLGLQESRSAADLERIRRAAERHPRDPFARRVLARAEALHGDAAAADRLLDPLIAANPNDAELLYAKGMRHMRAARAAADPAPEHRRAASWFVRAHRADPDHFPTLYQYAQSLRSQPGFVSENTENILLLAAQLAPQVHEVRLLAGEMLLLRAKYGEAKAMLMPVALSPHAEQASKSARVLIEMAEARRPVNQAEIRAALERVSAPAQ